MLTNTIMPSSVDNTSLLIRSLLYTYIGLSLFIIVHSQSSFTPIRINVGGPSFIDTATNQTWVEETPYVTNNTGLRYNRCKFTNITNLTVSSTIRNVYCSHRYFRSGIDVQPYQFNIPVMNTTTSTNSYTVRLHFAEIAFRVINARIMNVYIEGVTVLSNLDIFALVGKDAAYRYTIPQPIYVFDGMLSITMNATKENAMLSGIEVLPIVPTTPPNSNVIHRINCGSTTQVIQSSNIIWSADQFVTTGESYNTCGNITTSIYCTNRYFRATRGTPFRYNIPIPYNNAPYQVKLHFAEQFHNVAGRRIFDAYIEGALVVNDIDIVRDAPGKNVPYVISINTFVSDGFVTIEFVTGLNYPQINGIEIIYTGAPAAPIQTTHPTAAPIPLPPNSPPVPAPTAGSFPGIFINCGGPLYLENSGIRYWGADNFFYDGSTYSTSSIPIANTVDDPIYQSERYGEFTYQIPVPVDTYEISIHLAELSFTTTGQRKFNITIENQLFPNVDIVALAGGGQRAVKLSTVVVVDDGAVSISVKKVIQDPKINGIEIRRSLPHLAHAVANGPYRAVDSTNVGFATIFVDGSESHTHAIDKVLNRWTWKKGSQILATGETASFSLPVGTHNVALTVVDSGGNESTEETIVTVNAFGYPDIAELLPSSGNIAGGNVITIKGTGFRYNSNRTTVYFGVEKLQGSSIQIINSTTITLLSPKIAIAVPVQVSVETPLGRSAEKTFTYTTSTTIRFKQSKLTGFTQPTAAAFGPDGKLYVGTLKGTLAKITMNPNFSAIDSMVTSVVQLDRAILGITFDPMDAGNRNPPVYISSSFLFHGGNLSSSGTSINGKISRISGANLDVITDIITGLPVCDLDHAVNQIEFGNNGRLYINIGSNTNGGIPGRLSGSGQLKENYFSAATISADLSNPSFNGAILYDKPDDGIPYNSVGISIFAPGQRNPFGIVQHSNGQLYGTDNGPNTGYGNMKVGCGPSDMIDDQQREDKLNRIVQNRYYGHPNMIRAVHLNDPRQCVWRSPTEVSSSNYEAPMAIQLSSATGIIEYQADHFSKQLRGNLIHVKYKSSLRRTVLSSDGLTVNPLTSPAISFAGNGGLDVTQAPNGNLIEVRYITNSIFLLTPIEASTSSLIVNSVFPTRGSQAGGTILKIYGYNFGSNPSTKIGSSICPIVGSPSATYIECTIPGGSPGLYDVTVSSATSGSSYVFQKGYRYITGV